MRAMKDSGIKWIGEIPDEWTTGIINWIADEISVPPFCKEGFSYIGMKNVESNTSRIVGELDNAENYSSSIKYFDKETILLGKLRPYLAKAVFPKFMGICSSEFLTLKTQQVNPRYLVRLLACYKLSDCFNSDTTGVKMPRTNWAQIKKIGCPIPPFEEQEIIADYLDAQCEMVDLAIESAESSIEEYKAYKKSVIFETVTKGLDPYASMKDTCYKYLGEVPSHWILERSKNIFREVSVKRHPHEMILSLYREYGVVPKDSRDDNHNVTSLDTSTYKLVNIGNLVINKMKAWQGSLAFSAYRGIISPAYLIFELIAEDIEIKYLNYLLRSAHYADEFARLSTGIRIGQWDLHSNDFLNTVVAIPPKGEQIEIAAFLDAKCKSIDEAIVSKQTIIEELKAYKKSLIYEVVTGKREIDGC